MSISSSWDASQRAERGTECGHRKSQVSTHAGGVKRGLTRFEYLHVMIDDHSRLAYAEVLPTLTARCSIEFLGEQMPGLQSAACGSRL